MREEALERFRLISSSDKLRLTEPSDKLRLTEPVYIATVYGALVSLSQYMSVTGK